MCVPMIAMAAGAAVSAASSLFAGSAAAGGYEFQAAQATQQAGLEREKADWDVGRVRENTRKVMGSQVAGYSAAGVALEGTPQTIAFDTLTESEKDIYAIRWGAEVRAANYLNEATLAMHNASSARTAGYLNAAGAVIKGVGNIATEGKSTAVGPPATRMGHTIFDGNRSSLY